MNSKPSLPSRLAISVAVATAMLTGYGGRKAYAACSGGPNSYACITPETTTQNLTGGTSLQVTTGPGFGITTTTGNAFTLSGSGTSLIFTDNNTSTITGAISGIYAGNYGTGVLSITTTGAVAGGQTYGIYADNTGTGTNLIISTADVTGGNEAGIHAINRGSGYLDITSINGTIQGVAFGIFAENKNKGTNLKITTASVTSVEVGIRATNNGNGYLFIDSTSGTVDGGYDYDGITAKNNNGTNLTITSFNVWGGANGIDARNYGSGALSVTTTGEVTGNNNDGINANNSAAGTDLTINTAAVSGGDQGIQASSFGSGIVSITSTGAVTGGAQGIYAYNSTTGTAMVIHTSEVNGATRGIDAINNGSGSLSITTTGAVTGSTSDGIHAYNNGTGSITVNINGAVTGTTGILTTRDSYAPATITSHAPITGTAANGFAINLVDDAHDVVNLGGGTVITGNIDFGDGNDPADPSFLNPNDIDTLNALPGFNGVVTFADASGDDTALASAPENVSSNIAIINEGKTAVAFDPSGFAASGMFLGSFTGAILNSIDNGSTPTTNGGSANSFTGLQANGLSQRHWVSGLGGRQEIKTAGNSGVSGFSANGVATPYAEGSGSIFWVSGFGGYQEIEADSNNADLDNNFAGIMAGAESSYNGGIIGVLGGYGVSDIDIAYGAGSTETDSAFAGAYWKKDYGTHRVNLALIGGSADQEFRRDVAGATAKGKADGWFISPSATFTAPITSMPVTTIGSVRVSYSGLFLDGYTETGVANPLDVSDRDIHLLNARAQLAFPHDFENKDGSHSHLEIRAGVDAQYDLGSDKVSGVVGGTAIKFSADLDDKVSGFVGATLTRTNQKGDLAFAISGELQSAFDGGYQAVGEARVIKRF